MAEESAKEVSSESSGGGGNKLLLILLSLNMVFMIGVGVVVFLGQKQQTESQSIDKLAEGAVHGGDATAASGTGEEGAESEAASKVRFFNVGEFTANLSGPGAAHFVRLNLSLELDQSLDEEEMKKRSPQIRDKVITLLNSKRPQDLQSKDGRVFLKEEIRTSINSFLQTGKILGVYFSTFVFE